MTQKLKAMHNKIPRQVSVASGSTNNWQNKHEKIDNVEIKVERREDVLFRRERVLVMSSDH